MRPRGRRGMRIPLAGLWGSAPRPPNNPNPTTNASTQHPPQHTTTYNRTNHTHPNLPVSARHATGQHATRDLAHPTRTNHRKPTTQPRVPSQRHRDTHRKTSTNHATTSQPMRSTNNPNPPTVKPHQRCGKDTTNHRPTPTTPAATHQPPKVVALCRPQTRGAETTYCGHPRPF